MPIRTTGTSHSGMSVWPNPSSSSGFISAGRTGSVSAMISEAAKATAMPCLPDLKYGAKRARRCSKVGMVG